MESPILTNFSLRIRFIENRAVVVWNGGSNRLFEDRLDFMKIEKYSRNAILRGSWYFTLIVAVIAAVSSIWTYQQYLCCGMSDFWPGFWLAVGMICAGWTAAVVVLIRQRRI